MTPSLELVKEVINKGVDAILLTHIGGYPIPEIIKIKEHCKKNNTLLIEDCAHAPLTRINGKLVGSFRCFYTVFFQLSLFLLEKVECFAEIKELTMNLSN